MGLDDVTAEGSEELDAQILEDVRKNSPRGRAARDVRILMLRARGATIDTIAKEVKTSRQTVSSTFKRHEVPLEAMRDHVSRIALIHGQERADEMNVALIDSVCDKDSRNQPQAAKVWLDMAGLGAKKVHIGDSYTANVTVDLGSKHIHVGHDPELEAKLRAELVGD